MKRADPVGKWVGTTVVVVVVLVIAFNLLLSNVNIPINLENTYEDYRGPKVSNDCDQDVIAAINVSSASAQADLLGEYPITIRSGQRQKVGWLVRDSAVPETLFLVVGVDAASTSSVQIETSGINDVLVGFMADCQTLVKL